MSSYQVISRKWRPAVFSEVVGQEHVVRTLKNAVKTGKVGHAYLFSGPRGVGKTTVARILAKCLECVKGPTPEPCNSCDMCKGITGGTSVDVLEIDGASNTGVDNIRELRESVKYAPAAGKYKIYIIDEVHMLSDSAFNALLKTLEEPPPHVVFIFATTEPHEIPLTIHSRCQRFDFRRVPTKIIQEHLAAIAKKEGIDIDDDSLYLLIREAEGSLRDAQSILEQVAAFSGVKIRVKDVNESLGLMDRSVIYELMGGVLRKDAAACLGIIESINDFGYDLKKAASELLELTRDLVILKVCGKDAKLDVSDGELEKLREFGSVSETEALQLLFRILSKGYEDVARSSTPRFAFEMAIVGACTVGDLRPTGELMARLEELVKGGSIPGKPAGGERLGVRVSQPSERPKVAEQVGPVDGAKNPRSAAVEAVRTEVSEPKTSLGATAADFMDFLSGKAPRLYKPLLSAVVTFEAGVLKFATDAASYRMLEFKKEELASAAEECFGRKVMVSIVKDETLAPKAEASVKPLTQDPVVRDALKTFGAKVIKEG